MDLGGGGDPRNMDLSPLANARHQPRGADDFPQPKNYRENARRYAEAQGQAMEEQGIKPPGGGGGGGRSSTSQVRATGSNADRTEFDRALAAYQEDLEQDAKLRNELTALFMRGKGDTEGIFLRMLWALTERLRIVKRLMKRGLEIDPIAFMLRKAKQFVKRVRETRMQSTAAAVLFDFSGSMESVQEELAFSVAATGINFWKLREAAPQHFFYDLAWFTADVETAIRLGERMSEAELARRLVAMANRIAQGGTAILPAMEAKLKDFLSSREARSARVKYLILFTDGADSDAVTDEGDRKVLTPAMKKLMAQYREGGIEVFAIGIGSGAEDVTAFDGPGLHYIQIAKDRAGDISETIAKVAEAKSNASLAIPDGDVTEFLQIGEAKAEPARKRR